MLSEPTIDQLRERGLTGMIDALLELRGNSAAADLSHEEWLGLLLDRETTKQANKRTQSRLRAAKLRQQAVFEDVDYRIPRCLDRGQFLRLGSNQWIRDKSSLLITGACGLGKSYLACALGHKACRDNISVIYRRCHRMFFDLGLARLDGSYARQFKALVSTRLLILDDFGPEQLTTDQRRDLLELIEERHGTAATLITSQLAARDQSEQLPAIDWIGCPPSSECAPRASSPGRNRPCRRSGAAKPPAPDAIAGENRRIAPSI